ncbi:dynamin family protein [Terasakiella pusilla]|uniref:dynamin family protein n=1 Tax=Terasakiella pusilla TaxID=64973 RepID=UPI00068C38A2|nr:dynamin family protein [Terasakiella pusilla]
MTNNSFEKIYNDIQNDVAEALNSIEEIKIKDAEGNAYIDKLKDELVQIHSQFSDELKYLEEHSEWEKFTIAFFGETNAGKSTILESLRILFKEQQRQKNIESNTVTTNELEVEYSQEFNELQDELNLAYQSYSGKITHIRNDIASLTEHINKKYNPVKYVLRYTLISITALILGGILGAHFSGPFNSFIKAIFWGVL